VCLWRRFGKLISKGIALFSRLENKDDVLGDGREEYKF
jgi:hypothetical protein